MVCYFLLAACILEFFGLIGLPCFRWIYRRKEEIFAYSQWKQWPLCPFIWVWSLLTIGIRLARLDCLLVCKNRPPRIALLILILLRRPAVLFFVWLMINVLVTFVSCCVAACCLTILWKICIWESDQQMYYKEATSWSHSKDNRQSKIITSLHTSLHSRAMCEQGRTCIQVHLSKCPNCESEQRRFVFAVQSSRYDYVASQAGSTHACM